MDETKLYFCFEATNIRREPVYLIYSAKVSDLTCVASDPTLTFTIEHAISGVQSMGCGVFGSKIVLAGGLVVVGENEVHNHGLITYDTASKYVSREDIPSMCGRKLRPLVLQLNNRLYVLDTSKRVHDLSFEIYSPKKNLWRRLLSPYFKRRFSNSIEERISGRNPYSWFVLGNCLCISVPKHWCTFLHHARQTVKHFTPCFNKPLPFHGMATTHYQQNFSDAVLIIFSKGRVEGCRLNISDYSFGDPQLIFETEPYEPDGELNSYFADCGDGRFCLTTFDDANIHVYMFKIFRHPDSEDGAFNLYLIGKNVQKYDFSNFSTGGNTSFSFLGCFVPPRDDWNKQYEEAKIYRSHFLLYEWGKFEDDVPLRIETDNGSLQT